jgi:hypothetical protein
MNLDDFKSLTKDVTAPAGAPAGGTNLDSFIAEMRGWDQRERRHLMGMALVYLSLGLVFAGAAMGEQPGNRVIGVGILFVAVYAGLKGRQFGRVNYAAPAREFLAAAARRYQFWRATDALYVIPLLLIMFVGGGLTVWGIAQKYFSQPHVPLVLAAYVVFVAAVCVFGFIQGRKQWQRKSAGFLEEIHRRQLELSNG